MDHLERERERESETLSRARVAYEEVGYKTDDGIIKGKS